jgi:hypothetical protein
VEALPSGEPAALDLPSEPVTGGSHAHAHLLAPLRALRSRSASGSCSSRFRPVRLVRPIVDTVTFVVSSSIGLAVGSETIPYVAGWREDGALDAVTQFAEMIESVARRIEDALSHHGHDAAWAAHPTA